MKEKRLLSLLKTLVNNDEMNSNEVNELIDISNKNNIIDYLCFFNDKRKNPIYKISIYKRIVYSNNCAYYNKIKNVLDDFNKKNINYALIKGYALSYYIFNDPNYRYFKDVDLIIDKEHYLKAKKILKKNGYKNEYNLSSKVERKMFGDDIVFSDKYRDSGFEIKLKPRLFDEDNLKCFFNNLKLVKNGSSSFKTTTKEITFIYLISNFVFCTYYEYGVKNKFSIKLFLDLFIFVNQNEIDHSVVIELISKLNLNEVYNIFIYIINNFFNEDFYELTKLNLNAIIELLLEYADKLYDFTDCEYREKSLLNIYLKKLNNNIVSKTNSLDNLQFNNGYVIYRLFDWKKRVKSKLFVKYDFHIFNDCLLLAIKIPRNISNFILEIALYGDIEQKFEILYTYYEKDIYEINTNLYISNIFKFLFKKEHCIVFRINKDYFNKNIGKNFVCRILARQIYKNYYPIIANEDYNYIRYSIKEEGE